MKNKQKREKTQLYRTRGTEEGPHMRTLARMPQVQYGALMTLFACIVKAQLEENKTVNLTSHSLPERIRESTKRFFLKRTFLSKRACSILGPELL